MKSISQLVDLLGKDHLINNVERIINIKYKKCSEDEQENPPKAIFETDYENNLDSTIKTVNNSIELKAVDHIYVCSLVLELLNPNYKQLLLEKADYILIQRGKYPILQIINNKNPNSGIYIDCDIQYLQTNLECENKRRLKNNIDTIGLTFIASIGIVFVWKQFL